MQRVLKESRAKRAKCLGDALGLAVSKCERRHYCPSCGSWGGSEDDAEVVRVLLAAPPHWGPITQEVLVPAVREVTKLVVACSDGEDTYTVIELLGKAGADLSCDDGELLDAAFKRSSGSLLKALAAAGVDIREHGKAALRSVRDPAFAVELIKMGVTVDSDPVTLERLLRASMGSLDTTLPALLGAEPRIARPTTRVSLKGSVVIHDHQ
jgi:hypothetical protein